MTGYSYTDNHRQKFTSDGFSPNAALTLQASDELSFRLGGSRTVRGAGLKEAFMIDNGPGTAIYRNEKNLKAETADNLELSANYRSGGFDFKAAVFRMNIADYITMVFDAAAANPASRRNVGKVESNGYELGAGWRAGNFRSGISVFHSQPKLNGADLGDGDFSLGVSTGRTWLFTAGYALPAWNVDLGWTGKYVESLRYQPAGAGEQQKKSYAVHDLYVNWLPLGKEQLRLTLSVRNLFDKFLLRSIDLRLQRIGGAVSWLCRPGAPGPSGYELEVLSEILRMLAVGRKAVREAASRQNAGRVT